MKRFGISIMVFGIVFFLTGCLPFKNQLQTARWRARAEENAIEYIKDKYGFEAEVLSSETQMIEGVLTVNSSSQTLVKMKYDGKEFGVLSNGNDEYMDDASDNYQKDEIEEAYREEVYNLFGIEPNTLEMKGGDNASAKDVNGEDFYDMYFHEYFDGTNLEEVLMQYQFYSLVEYVGDVDLDTNYAKNVTPLFENNYMCTLFVRYDSEEDMEKSSISITEISDNTVYENAFYVSDALMKDWIELIAFDMSIGQCGDFYYLNVGADTSQYSIKQAQEVHDVSDWNGYGAIDTIAIEDTAYYMEGDGEYILYIYYPDDKYSKLLAEHGVDNVKLASTYIFDETGERDYDFSYFPEEIEGYKVFVSYYADCEDYSFRFAYDAEE